MTEFYLTFGDEQLALWRTVQVDRARIDHFDTYFESHRQIRGNFEKRDARTLWQSFVVVKEMFDGVSPHDWSTRLTNCHRRRRNGSDRTR